MSRASKVKGSVGVFVVVASIMVADEADVDGREEREDEGLDEADEDFEHAGDGRDDVRSNAAEGMDQVLSAEDVAVETERERNQAGGDREDFNDADAKEDEAQHHWAGFESMTSGSLGMCYNHSHCNPKVVLCFLEVEPSYKSKRISALLLHCKR